MESVSFLGEYKNQLEYLKQNDVLKSVTMSQFAYKFSKIYPKLPNKVILNFADSKWILRPDGRTIEMVKDPSGYEPEFKGINIKYNQSWAFSDYFLPDQASFLDRKLAGDNIGKPIRFFPWFLLVISGAGLIAFFKKMISLWLAGTLFIVASYGLIIRSGPMYGWNVDYGPHFSNLIFVQIGIILGSYLLIFLMYLLKKIDINRGRYFWLLPLSFGLDPIVNSLKFTNLSGISYLGFFYDDIRFFGLSFSWPFHLGVVNQEFTISQAVAFLGLNFAKIL